MNKVPVRFSRLLQNVFVVDGTEHVEQTPNPSHTIETVDVLVRKNLPNGFVEEVETKPYPINSASVTSYADSANYRNDPVSAVANATKRVNLGDVAGVQEFLASDPQRAVKVFSEVLPKITAYFETQQKTESKKEVE